MPDTLSEQTIATVQATLPALEAHGLAIVQEMYARMFRNPDIRALFNQSHHGEAGSQPRALTAAILAYAANIDNLGVLASAVERIAQKHVAVQIRPDHYPHVADALLGAIAHVLGDAATPEILAAWGEAYWFLAKLLIAREARIADELASEDGGWRGWRPFVVEAVQPESEVITSFLLRPADGGRVVRHKPGQYLTFWLEIPGRPPIKRNYSISSAANGETYRISVKREPHGIASTWLHDQVRPGAILNAAPPAGEFHLASAPARPVVLMSGGVGLTPMVAMLETIAEHHPELEAHFVHGTQHGGTHALADHVVSLVERLPNARVTRFYEAPRAEDRAGQHFDRAGRIAEDWLLAATPVTNADYYLCGPRPFLRTYVAALAQAGVPSARIHYEFFGPADELLAA